jgi:hypothetical protein
VTTTFPHHYALLEHIHQRLQPRSYFEIGVDAGLSLRFAGPDTRVVGVDPVLREDVIAAHPAAHLVEATSDDFFASHDLTALMDGPVDLAFIDGMHRFENVLRDLANLQPHVHDHTLVLIHDCLPTDEACAARERTTVAWAGDVWKAACALAAEWPDDRFVTLDVAPTGMGVIRGLSQAAPLHETLDDWVDRYGSVPFARYESNPDAVVRHRPTTADVVDALLADGVRPVTGQ